MVQPADELVSTFPDLARSKDFPAQVRSTTPFETILDWVRNQVHNAALRKGVSGSSRGESGGRHQHDQDLT